MKSILKCILSFFILFSMVDLSAINLLRAFHFNINSEVSMTEVVDVESLLAPIQANKMFFDIDKTERKIQRDNCFNFVKLVLPVFVSNISYVLRDTKVFLFFFLIIFVFMLRYLGLLFTFDGITISKRYKNAYSM